MLDVIMLPRECLLNQYAVRRTGPCPCPSVVGPAEAEGKIRLTAPDQRFYWFLENLTTREPVVIKAERMYPVLLGQVGLRLSSLWQSEVVEPEVSRDVGLIVSPE